MYKVFHYIICHLCCEDDRSQMTSIHVLTFYASPTYIVHRASQHVLWHVVDCTTDICFKCVNILWGSWYTALFRYPHKSHTEYTVPHTDKLSDLADQVMLPLLV